MSPPISARAAPSAAASRSASTRSSSLLTICDRDAGRAPWRAPACASSDGTGSLCANREVGALLAFGREPRAVVRGKSILILRPTRWGHLARGGRKQLGEKPLSHPLGVGQQPRLRAKRVSDGRFDR